MLALCSPFDIPTFDTLPAPTTDAAAASKLAAAAMAETLLPRFDEEPGTRFDICDGAEEMLVNKDMGVL